MAIKQISALVENKPGKLYELFQTIKEEGINIRAMNIADTKDFGVLRLIVQDCEKAKKVIGEETVVALTDVVAVEMVDKAGALCDIIQVLAEAGINIEYAYALTSPTKLGAYTVLRTDRTEGAEAALKAAGYALLNQEEIDAL